MFASHGVDPTRLVFAARRPVADYLALHAEVDLALDPFPYNGGTITRNSLWMGVPVVTLAGESAISRVGLALLSSIGLDAFVARDEECETRCVNALRKCTIDSGRTLYSADERRVLQRRRVV